MTDKSRHLGDDLMAADKGSSSTPQERDKMFADMIRHEEIFEERLRKVIISGWAFTVGSMVLGGIGVFAMRNGGGAYGGGIFVEVMRVIAPLFGILGAISLIVALLATIAWLFRSRTPSLAAIERRLASLEIILRERA